MHIKAMEEDPLVPTEGDQQTHFQSYKVEALKYPGFWLSAVLIIFITVYILKRCCCSNALPNNVRGKRDVPSEQGSQYKPTRTRGQTVKYNRSKAERIRKNVKFNLRPDLEIIDESEEETENLTRGQTVKYNPSKAERVRKNVKFNLRPNLEIIDETQEETENLTRPDLEIIDETQKETGNLTRPDLEIIDETQEETGNLTRAGAIKYSRPKAERVISNVQSNIRCATILARGPHRPRSMWVARYNDLTDYTMKRKSRKFRGSIVYYPIPKVPKEWGGTSSFKPDEGK